MYKNACISQKKQVFLRGVLRKAALLPIVFVVSGCAPSGKSDWENINYESAPKHKPAEYID